MKKKIVFLIVMLVLVVGAYTGYKYLYKDHRNIGEEVAAMEVSATKLQEMFLSDSSENVLNKTLIVNGTITQIEDNSMTIDEKVHCSFELEFEGLTMGDTVSIKGRCIGYDNLFEIVKLDQSSLIRH